MKTTDIQRNHSFILHGFTILLILFSLGALLSSCTKTVNSPSAFIPTPALKQVIMLNSSYFPQNLTISPGTTIIWKNQDPYDHTVTSGNPGNPSGLFNSGDITPHGEFSYTFDSIGVYNYYCELYLDKMTGTITVK
jgi:plastocyanin